MTARNDPHASTLHGRGRKRQPSGHDVTRLIQAPIGDVLMPADVIVALGLLGEKHRLPGQDIRPDDPLHGIQDLRMSDHFLRPAIDQMRLVLVFRRESAACRGFGGL
jgi:hypothetical protein